MAKAILLPIDLSDSNSWARALPVAMEQAKLMDAELHVATVVPDFGLSSVSTYMEEGFEQKVLHKVGEDLASWVAKTVPEGVTCHPHVLHGSIYDEIIRAAGQLDVDLIVMGSHRPSLKDYLLGPNTARVVRHAKHSVYVVRGKDTD